MSEYEFINEFEDEKIKGWKDNYIDYIKLRNEITKIYNKFCINNNDISFSEKEEEEEDKNEIKIELNKSFNNKGDKSNIIENIEELEKLNNSLGINNDIISRTTSKKIEILKKPTKYFMSLVDKEIKKIHIFYTSKETNLYENINSQISIFKLSKNKNNNKAKIDIISNLEYLSNFCDELINYVYINIKALIRILKIYDFKLIEISYNYIKKYLSKNNGDLVYILNFKTLDETIVAIQELKILIEKDFNENKYLKNNKNEKDEYNNYCENIIDNIENINYTYEQIFEELKDWEKYLNISLGLPSSTFNSVFKLSTSMIGDSIPRSSYKAKRKKKKKSDRHKKISSFNNSNKIEKLRMIYEEKEVQKENLEDIKNYNGSRLSIGNSDLFRQSEIFSYKTKKVLSRSNISNLNFLLPLVFFFSFSISFLIPIILILLHNKIEDKVYLYGVVISIHSIGNLFAKFSLKYFLNKSYKLILVFSSFFLLSHYILLFLGIKLNDIIFIIIGRFLLGFSFIKHLSKSYVEQFVPISNQIKANKKYMISLYMGFAIGFLSNSFYYFDLDNKSEYEIFFKFNYIELITIIYTIISIILFIFILTCFNVPSSDSLLNDIVRENNKRHRLSKLLIDKKEKEEANFHDKNYSLANDASDLAKTNLLSEFVIDNLNNNYYRKIFFILFCLLISTEYIRENILLYIPKLISYNINKNINKNVDTYIIIYGPIIISLAFIISNYYQELFLGDPYMQKHERKFMITIIFVLIILNLYFILTIKPDLFSIKNTKYSQVYFPSIGIFFMIILNEFYHIIIINIFIKLLPTEKNEYCCGVTFFIIFATKMIRIIPSTIIIIFNFLLKCDEILLKEEKNSDDCCFNYCNLSLFGFQLFILIFCFILCLCNLSSLRFNSRNRLLYLK